MRKSSLQKGELPVMLNLTNGGVGSMRSAPRYPPHENLVRYQPIEEKRWSVRRLLFVAIAFSLALWAMLATLSYFGFNVIRDLAQGIF